MPLDQSTSDEQNRSQSETERRRERELTEAVERVHRHYGNDLSAFYRDAHRESQNLEKRNKIG
jgi:hypothetical protein